MWRAVSLSKESTMEGHCQRRGCQTYSVLYLVESEIFGADAARGVEAGKRWYCRPCIDDMMQLLEYDHVALELLLAKHLRREER
jgi:hypothetical protein